MKVPRLRTALVLCALASKTAWCQSLADLHPGQWGGSFKADYELDNDHVHSLDGSSDMASGHRSLREGLNLHNEGFYFLDPRLVSANLGLTFERVQERETANGAADSSHASLIGYAFNADIVPVLPYSGRIYANRNEDRVNQPFGRTETAFDNRGLELRLREDNPLRSRGFPYLSANARIEQQHLQETTTSVTGQAFHNDERQSRLNLDAHNGFETADLNLNYDLARVKNGDLPQASFDSQRANLRYSLDFGPTLNRRSDTQMSYSSRTGASTNSVLTANERLRIEHYSNLSSSYSYGLVRTDAATGTSVSHDGSIEVRHQLYQNLTTTAQVAAQQQQLPSGARDNYAGQLNLAYRRSLPWGGTVSARAGRRHQLDDNRLQTAQISITDEAQTAPSSLGAGAGFLLNQPFAIASSVVVVDTRGGARLPTTLGTDYEVLAEGNLTRIVPLATSAVIQAGDPLVISYSYQVDPSIRYTTDSDWIGGGLDFRWIALSLDHQQSHQTLISGQDDGFLQDLRQDNARFDLRGAWRTLQGTASAAYIRYDSTRLAYAQRQYTQTASYWPARGLALGLNMDRTAIDYTLPARQTLARSARLTLDYYRVGWTTTGQLGRRVYKDSLQPVETVDEARLTTRFAYGKLSLAAALTAARRARGGFQTSNYGLHLSAVRQF